MGSHAALIAKLEAGEASRALSDEVLVAMGWTTHTGWNDEINWVSPDGNEHGNDADSRPDPAHNLQDALDLVTIFHAYIDMTIEPEMEGCDRVCLAIIRIDADTRFSGTSTTPALALCVANLKALETGDG